LRWEEVFKYPEVALGQIRELVGRCQNLFDGDLRNGKIKKNGSKYLYNSRFTFILID
jgi:hypothetical protein